MVEKVSKRYDIGRRFAKIRHDFCENSNKYFAQKLDIGDKLASNYCGGTKKPGEKVINRVLTAFPQVSRTWLMFGEGDMLVDNHGDIVGNNAGGDILGNGAQKNADSERLLTIVESQQATIQRQAEQISTLIGMLNK